MSDDFEEPRRLSARKVVALSMAGSAIAASVIAAAAWLMLRSPPPASAPPQPAAVPQAQAAPEPDAGLNESVIQFARKVVSKSLKSGVDSEFLGDEIVRFVKEGEYWKVTGTARGQNSFGAKLPIEFELTTERNAVGEFVLRSFRLGEDTILHDPETLKAMNAARDAQRAALAEKEQQRRERIRIANAERVSSGPQPSNPGGSKTRSQIKEEERQQREREEAAEREEAMARRREAADRQHAKEVAATAASQALADRIATAKEWNTDLETDVKAFVAENPENPKTAALKRELTALGKLRLAKNNFEKSSAFSEKLLAELKRSFADTLAAKQADATMKKR